MKAEERYERIERYCSGEMAHDERLDFEREVRADAALREEVELHRKLALAIGNAGERALGAKLAALKQQDKRRFILVFGRALPQWYRYAAAVILVAIVPLVYWFAAPDSRGAVLFAQYFKPYPLLSSTRSEALPADSGYSRALVLYESRRYREAIALFGEVDTGDSSHAQAQLLRGVSYLALEKPDAALAELDAPGTSPEYEQPAAWFRALALLSLNETVAACEQLRIVAAGGSAYASTAEELLRELQQD